MRYRGSSGTCPVAMDICMAMHRENSDVGALQVTLHEGGDVAATRYV